MRACRPARNVSRFRHGHPRHVTPSPTIAIVGSAGTYGRWLRGFFERRMGLRVLGHDPGDPRSDAPEVLVEQADVPLFATPIRMTAAGIDDYVRRSAGREAGRLWLDITSINAGAVAARRRSPGGDAGTQP